DDARREGVGADAPASNVSFCSNWPCASESKARPDNRIKKRLPSSAGYSLRLVALRLFESVVDGDWEGRMRLCKSTHRRSHPMKKEALGVLFAPVPIRLSNKLILLRHFECREEFRKHWLQ